MKKIIILLLLMTSIAFAQVENLQNNKVAGTDSLKASEWNTLVKYVQGIESGDSTTVAVSVVGWTTTGEALVKLTDPNAVRFIRINADNTVTALSDSDFRIAIGAGDMIAADFSDSLNNRLTIAIGRAGSYNGSLDIISSSDTTVSFTTEVFGYMSISGATSYLFDAPLIIGSDTLFLAKDFADSLGLGTKTQAYSSNLSTLSSPGNWKVFYTNGSGAVQALDLGSDGTYLRSSGPTSAPTFSTLPGSGDVSKVGTPVDNQVGVWTGDGTIEGDADLTFDGDTLQAKVIKLGTGGMTNITSLEDVKNVESDTVVVNTYLDFGNAHITENEMEILDGATVTTAELNYSDLTTLGTSENGKIASYSAKGRHTVDSGDSIVVNGVLDINGSIEIPNGTNPITDVAGEITVDTDDHFVEFYSDASRALPALQIRTFTFYNPDSLGDDVVCFHFMADAFPHGATIKDIAISTSAASTDSITVEEWNDRAGSVQSTIEPIRLSGQYTEDDGTLSDADVAAGSFLNIKFDQFDDDCQQLEVTITYFIKVGD